MTRLGAQSLWVDEIMTLTAAAPGHAFTPALFFENYHGPLHAALLHAWTGVAGTSEFALRLPSAVAGVLFVPAVFGLGRALAGEGVGLAAAGLAAVSPFHVWYSQEARNYVFVMLFAALAGWAAWRIVDAATAGRPVRARTWAAYGAASAAAVLMNLDGAFVVLALALALLVLAPRTLFSRASLVTHAAIVLAVLPFTPAVMMWLHVARAAADVAPPQPLRGATTLPAAAVPYAFYTYATGYSLGPSLRDLHVAPSLAAVEPWLWAVAPAALAFGVLAALGAVSLARDRRRAVLLAAWIVVPLLCVVLLAWRNYKVFNPRYAAVILPALLVLLAAGARARPRALARTALGVALAACALSLAHLYGDARYAKDDMRRAGAILTADVRPGDAVLVEVAHLPLTYYYHGAVPYTIVYPDDCAPARARTLPARELPGRTRAWLVAYPYLGADPAGNVRSALAGWGRPVRHVDFTGGWIELFERRAPDPPARPPRSAT